MDLELDLVVLQGDEWQGSADSPVEPELERHVHGLRSRAVVKETGVVVLTANHLVHS